MATPYKMSRYKVRKGKVFEKRNVKNKTAAFKSENSKRNRESLSVEGTS
jgi:hypothetical protein